MKRIGLFVCFCLLAWTAPDTAGAQQVFQFPAYGGYVAHPFNDTNAAVPGRYHTGIDCLGPGNQATYIQASNVGKVYAVTINGQNDHGLGNCLILRHDVIVSSNGTTMPCYTLYAHLDGIANGLACGQVVKRGQVIGVMGSTGYGQRFYWGATPHLHFEVKSAGILSNPTNGGPYWGYTPKDASLYGYINPANVIGVWTAK